MKKKLLRMWIIYSLSFWVLSMGIYFLRYKNREGGINLLELSYRAVISSILPASGVILGGYLALSPRSKYLESNDIEKPSFKVPSSVIIDVPQGFDFSRLKSVIAKKWEITFSDDMKQVLKCRTNYNFSNWGSAAWIKYDDDAKKLYLECFPMAVGSMKYVAQNMQKAIENCLRIT